MSSQEALIGRSPNIYQSPATGTETGLAELLAPGEVDLHIDEKPDPELLLLQEREGMAVAAGRVDAFLSSERYVNRNQFGIMVNLKNLISMKPDEIEVLFAAFNTFTLGLDRIGSEEFLEGIEIGEADMVKNLLKGWVENQRFLSQV